MRIGESLISVSVDVTNSNSSLQFNIVSKRLGCERLSFYLNEAALEIRDLLMPDLLAEKEKAKL